MPVLLLEDCHDKPSILTSLLSQACNVSESEGHKYIDNKQCVFSVWYCPVFQGPFIRRKTVCFIYIYTMSCIYNIIYIHMYMYIQGKSV